MKISLSAATIIREPVCVIPRKRVSEVAGWSAHLNSPVAASMYVSIESLVRRATPSPMRAAWSTPRDAPMTANPRHWSL